MKIEILPIHVHGKWTQKEICGVSQPIGATGNNIVLFIKRHVATETLRDWSSNRRDVSEQSDV